MPYSREAKLKQVFDEFDLDGSGNIQALELATHLGKARRALDGTDGKQSLNWLPTAGGDGCVSKTQFLNHFERSLPRDASEFEAASKQFMKVCAAPLPVVNLSVAASGGINVSEGETARTRCKEQVAAKRASLE